MLRLIFIVATGALTACGPASLPVPVDDEMPVTELVRGHWYTGTTFEARTMYMVGDTLYEERPSGLTGERGVNTVLDLGGGYVVPPFGDAHSHIPLRPNLATNSIAFQRDAGVFYLLNQGSLVRYRDQLGSLTDRPDSIDVVFANAMIVSPQSHGVAFWQEMTRSGVFPDVRIDALDGEAYVVVESPEDIARRWPGILESRPGFIKIMLEFSEEYELREGDPRYFGRSGLDPDVVPAIVELAHDAGLRVSAHIETAADFHVAVVAGVDIVAHLPGYDIPDDVSVMRYRIDPADAERAAEQRTIVVTTTLLSVARADGDAARLARMQNNHRHNLKILHDTGVPIAIGTDMYGKHAVDEAMNLAALDVFDNATLLGLICASTPRAVFPERRIGTLDDGAEASFLVLEGNPIEALGYLRRIKLRVKDGIVFGSS